MKISEDTKMVIDFLEEINEKELPKKHDMSVILEIGAKTGKASLVNDMIFAGSSVWKMYNKLNSTDPADEKMEKIKIEMKRSYDEIQDYLSELISIYQDAGDVLFENNYFDNDQRSIMNIIELSSSLALLKEVQNQMKSR